MGAAEYKFRTALFGGFRKRDVLNYLEITAREHAERIKSLQDEGETLRQVRAELEARCMEGEERGAALASSRVRLEGDLTGKTQALEAARAEVDEKTRLLAAAQAELKQLREEAASLRERVRVMEPAAAAYETLKDRTAGVELEAHRRAKLVEEEAEARVKAKAQELEQWVASVRARYQRLRSDMEAMVAHASGELERASVSLGGLTGDFGEYDMELERIEERIRADIAHKPPRPLSLDGE